MKRNMRVSGYRLAAFAVAAAAGTSVLGDIYGYNHAVDDRMWGVNYMPDLDQVRQESGVIDGLPGNGVMYCIPTCASNIAAYTTWRGLGPWSQSMNWTSSAPGIYNTATDHIDDLGDDMGTTADGGTQYPGIFNGAAALFDGIPFDVSYFRVGGEGVWAWAPKTWDLVEYGLAGGLVDIVFGRYEWHLGGTDYVVVDERDSGHCLTLTRGTINPNGINEIRFRDPGSGGDAFTQSAYTTHTRVAQDFWVNRFGTNVWMTVIVDPDGWVDTSEQIRLIDSTLIVWPTWILLDPPPSGGDLVMNPNPTHGDPVGSLAPVVPLQPPHIPAETVDFTMRPDRQCVAYAFRLTPTVCGLQVKGVIDGETSGLMTLPDVRGMVYSRFMELYVLTDHEVIRYSTDRGVVTELSRWELPEGSDPRAVAYNDRTDEVWVLEPSRRRIYRNDHQLGTTRRALELAGRVNGDPLGPVEDATISMFVNPGDAQVWIANDRAGSVARYAPTAERPGEYETVQVIVDRVLRPTDVQMDSRGRLLVASGGGLLEFADTDHDGLVERVEPMYRDMRPHRKFEVTISRSNDATTREEAPGWRHVLIPEEFGEGATDCRADFDASGRVDSNDFFGFLEAFFEGRFSADATFDGVVDSNDFFDFLTEFFTGCR